MLIIDPVTLYEELCVVNYIEREGTSIFIYLYYQRLWYIGKLIVRSAQNCDDNFHPNIRVEIH